MTNVADGLTRRRRRLSFVATLSLAIACFAATAGGAAAAQAAPPEQWDQVAACESGGNWQSSTGRFQGGLQFSPSTWLNNGGGQYAPAANLASREQQIAVAEHVLASQGPGAWPHCGIGLYGAAVGPSPGVSGPTAAVNSSTRFVKCIANLAKCLTTNPQQFDAPGYTPN